MIDAALTLFSQRGVGAVVHAGDFVAPFAVQRLMRCGVPLYATFGNNDGERRGIQKLLPQIQEGPLRLTLDRRTILVHHFIDWCPDADLEWAEIVISGHTHEVVNRFEGEKLILNPGECCGWISGRPTVAILDTGGPSAELCELVEA